MIDGDHEDIADGKFAEGLLGADERDRTSLAQAIEHLLSHRRRSPFHVALKKNGSAGSAGEPGVCGRPSLSGRRLL
jgi:hypothetical protein